MLCCSFILPKKANNCWSLQFTQRHAHDFKLIFYYFQWNSLLHEKDEAFNKILVLSAFTIEYFICETSVKQHVYK